MSYILDALRRADAERQRGGVPGLHAQPAAPAPAGADRAPRLGAVALAGAAVGLLLAGGAAVWWLGGGRGAAVPTVAGPSPGALAAAPAAPAPAPALLAAGPPNAALPAPPQPGMAQLPALAPAVPPPTIPPPAGQPPATQPPLTQRPIPLPPAPARPLAGRPAVAPAAPAAPAGNGPLAAPAPAVESPAAPAAPARVPRLAELPEGLRRELPPLSLGGSVFADQPAARIVIINGQVFREGERPAPGLLVQQIGLRAVIFEFRGQRFEIPL